MTRIAAAERTGLLLLALTAACASPRVESTERLLERSRPATRAPALAARAPAGEAAPRAEESPAVWSLDAILDRIALSNPTVAEAEARLEEARAARAEARAAWYPELSLGLDAVSTDNPAQAFALLLNQQAVTLGPGFDPTPGSTENWRKELRLDWPLFAPGRSEAGRSAGEALEAARLGREALERRLLNAGVQAWLGLGAAVELEAVASQSVGVVERRLELTRRRHAEGAALRADVLRLEVRLAEARQAAARATLTRREAESALNTLMGRIPQEPLPLAGEEVTIGATLPEPLDELLAVAEADRLDLQAAAHDVRQLGFQSAASRAERYPVLHAFAAYDVDGDDLGLDTDLDSYTVGVGLRYPLSAGTRPRIRRAEARERQAREALRSLSAEVSQEVHDAWRGLAVAEETLALAQAAALASEEAFRLVAAAQDAGGATVTDVLEAENALDQARVRFVAARAGVQIARAALVAATGGVR